MSLGGAFPSKVLKKAVKYAHDKGVTVVCAAGNESRGKVGYPAAYPGAIAVAATQYDEATTFYSNYGKDIDIAAPGGNTRVDQNGDGNPDGGVLQNTIVDRRPDEERLLRVHGHVDGVAARRRRRRARRRRGRHRSRRGREDPQGHRAQADEPEVHDASSYGAGIIDAPAAILKARARAAAAGSSASAC